MGVLWAHAGAIECIRLTCDGMQLYRPETSWMYPITGKC